MFYLRSIYRLVFYKKFYGGHRGCYNSYEEAESKIKDISGWAKQDVADLFLEAFHKENELIDRNKDVYHPTKPINKNYLFAWDYPVIFWLQKLFRSTETEGIRVYDFGGNVGNHYYNYIKYIDPKIIESWNVIELPNLIEAGIKLRDSYGISNNTPTFIKLDDVSDDHNNCDLFIASSSLQYYKGDWISEILGKFVNLPTYVIINRTPFSQEMDSIFTIQNGGAVNYVHRVIPFCEIEKLNGLGYEMIDDWFDPIDTCFIPFSKLKVWYKGYLFKLKN